MDTKLDIVQSTLQETRTALSARIDRLAQEKANMVDLDPLRKAIERQNDQISTQCDELTAKADRVDFDAVRKLVLIGFGVALAIEIFVVPIIVGVVVFWLTRH